MLNALSLTKKHIFVTNIVNHISINFFTLAIIILTFYMNIVMMKYYLFYPSLFFTNFFSIYSIFLFFTFFLLSFYLYENDRH